MARLIRKGATSQSLYFEALDSASTTGGRKTGLAYNTAGLTAYYTRNGGSATAITLATLAAANSAWSSGGFKEVDSTNAPGLYRLDVPDSAFASGADSVVVTLKGASGMAQVSAEVQLVAWDPQDAVRGGLTALPNANAEAAGGLYTRGTGAGQINQPANGMVDANVVRNAGTAITAAAGVQEVKVASIAAGAITAASIAADAITDAKVASDVTIASVTGAVGSVTGAVGSVTGAVGSVTGNVGGNVTGSVGSVAAGGITASSIAADAIGASELAADAVAEIADAVWDEVLSGHLTSGTTGAGLNAAGSAGDPWATTVPGAYGAGTAGKILGDNLDAAVSSRLASAGYTAPLDASGTATATQTGLTAQGYTSTRAGYLDTLNGLVAAIWSSVTRTLTALADVTLATSQPNYAPAKAGDAMTLTGAYDAAKTAATQTSVDDLPTNAELATALGTADDPVLAAIAALNNLSSAGAQAAAAAALTAYGAALQSTLLTGVGYIDTEVAAIKAQTDKLTFDASNRVEANTTAVNDVALTGVGTTGDPWGPA